MRIKKGKIEQILFILYLFLYIFAPPLLPQINFVIIVFLFSSVKLLTKYRKEIPRIFIKANIKEFIILLGITYFYLLIITYFNVLFDYVDVVSYMMVLYRFIMITPIMIVCSMYIIIRCNEMKYNLIDLLKCYMYAGLLQAIISILMLLFPVIKSFLVNIMYMNGGGEILQNLWHLERRYFAFSHNILDTFGYGTGLLATFPIFIGLYNKNIKYLYFSPILLIVPALNARTGLLIFIIGILIYIYMLVHSNVKQIFKLTITSAVIIIFILGLVEIVNKVSPITLMWIQDGVQDLLNIFNDEKTTGSVSYLFSEGFWRLPDGIQLLFGTGHTVYGVSGFSHSDVGYINDLWLGGIIGASMLYTSFIVIFFLAYIKNIRNSYRFLVIFLCISFFVANIKTIIINYNVGTSITLSIIFFILNKNDNS